MMNRTRVLWLRRGKMKYHPSLCCTFFRCYRIMQLSPFPWRVSHASLVESSEPARLLAQPCLLFPLIAPKGGCFHQFSHLLFPQVCLLLVRSRPQQQFSKPVLFIISCWLLSLQFLCGLLGSSPTCLVPTQFIVLFHLEAIKGSFNPHEL